MQRTLVDVGISCYSQYTIETDNSNTQICLYFHVLLVTILNDHLSIKEVIVCLFVFLALKPIVFVLSQSGNGLWPPRFRGFLITHNDVPQSVGLLWTSDQSVAETST